MRAKLQIDKTTFHGTHQAEIRHFDVTRHPHRERRVNYKTSLNGLGLLRQQEQRELPPALATSGDGDGVIGSGSTVAGEG